jgi:hypothetical protein
MASFFGLWLEKGGEGLQNLASIVGFILIPPLLHLVEILAITFEKHVARAERNENSTLVQG